MAIHFDSERNQFLIETKNSHYIFFERNGRLKSGYWGQKLRRVEDVPLPGRMISGIPGEGSVNPDFYMSEFTGWGSRFFNEPTLKLTFADGVRDLDLLYAGHEISGDGNKLAVTLRDSHYGLEVELSYQIYPELDVIDRCCVVRNRTGAAITLDSAASASVNFPYREEPYRLTALGSAWAQEYEITRLPVTKAGIVLQSRAGVSNAGDMPYFALDKGDATENEGEVWFGALQWSGNHKITAEIDAARITRVTGGINDFDFAYVLSDGESFETPVFTLGFSSAGFSGASRQLHGYAMAVNDGPWVERCLPVVYNCWTSFEFDIDEPKLMALADRAADLGVELFVVDDGWFSTRDSDASGLGDWEPSPVKFPNGLDPLIRHVREKGMMFGIWVEPEMVNPSSRLYAEHPDWVLNFPTRKRELSRNQLILNLARQDVYDFIVGFLDELLTNHEIGYLKWDMNRWFSQPGWPEAGKNQQSMWYKYVRNFHKIFAYLHEKYPEVILENCCSGGLRADLAMDRWCDRINRSDNQDPVDELYLHEGFTYLHRSRSAGGAGHISANGTGIDKRTCPMQFKAHVGMMGSLGCGMDLRDMSEEELEELKGYIALHKKLRHVVQLGDLYRLASLREKDYMAVEFVSRDQTEAVVFLFAPVRKFALPYDSLKLYGLNPDLIYRTEDGFSMSGDGLMKMGFPSARHTLGNMQSRIFWLKANES